MNNLSSIRESKNEGTFLESKVGAQLYNFTGPAIGGIQINENTYSQSNTQSAFTPMQSTHRGINLASDVENDELQ